MTTDDSKAALDAALERHHDSEGFCVYCSSERVFEPWPCDAARAREEIARLRKIEKRWVVLEERLTVLYPANRAAVALVVDEAVDRSGAMLGRIRAAALAPPLDDIHGTPTFSEPT